MRLGWLDACALAITLAGVPLRGSEGALISGDAGQRGSAATCGYNTASFNDSEAVVNGVSGGTAYFGHSDWMMVGRDEDGGGAGSFDFTAYQLGSADSFMLVFKCGSHGRRGAAAWS
jgi:hypothetical protein